MRCRLSRLTLLPCFCINKFVAFVSTRCDSPALVPVRVPFPSPASAVLPPPPRRPNVHVKVACSPSPLPIYHAHACCSGRLLGRRRHHGRNARWPEVSLSALEQVLGKKHAQLTEVKLSAPSPLSHCGFCLSVYLTLTRSCLSMVSFLTLATSGVCGFYMCVCYWFPTAEPKFGRRIDHTACVIPTRTSRSHTAQLTRTAEGSSSTPIPV